MLQQRGCLRLAAFGEGLVCLQPRQAREALQGVVEDMTDVVLNLRSFERATNALVFFDHHIPRTVARVTAMTVSNRLLSTAEAASLGSLDQYFDHAEVVVR